MNKKPTTGNKTLKNLRLWWIVISGTAVRIFAIAGAISIAALIAIGSFSGFNASEVNAELSEKPEKESIPQLVLINKDNSETLITKNTNKSEEPINDNTRTEILASGKGDKTIQTELNTLLNKPVVETSPKPLEPVNNSILVTQSSTEGEKLSIELQLKNLVDQAMNPSQDSVPTAREDTTEVKIDKEKTPKSTNDLLKALVSRATASPSEPGQQGYLSSLNSESETTIVIDGKTAQKPAQNSLSKSDRIKLIQDIASRVALDSDETNENVEYVTIEEKDSLWLIAKKLYNDPYKYKLLYSANRDILLSENSLIVGQKIRVPKAD